LEANKQKLLSLASGQDIFWDGGSGCDGSPAVADSTTQAQNRSIPHFVWGYKYPLGIIVSEMMFKELLTCTHALGQHEAMT
jgi:hypothetical protein